MQKYIVQITPKALNDIDAIYNYIFDVLQAPIAALQQRNRILQGIESLDFFPRRIKTINNTFCSKHEIRQLPIDNYSIFFVIRDNCVIILRVLYSASDIYTRLEE